MEIAWNARNEMPWLPTRMRFRYTFFLAPFLFFFFFFHRRNGVVIFATRYASVVTKYCWRHASLSLFVSVLWLSRSTLAAAAPLTRLWARRLRGPGPCDDPCFIFSVTGAGTRSLVRSAAFECLRREVVSPRVHRFLYYNRGEIIFARDFRFIPTLAAW